MCNDRFEILFAYYTAVGGILHRNIRDWHFGRRKVKRVSNAAKRKLRPRLPPNVCDCDV